jgi:hypothetical protein
MGGAWQDQILVYTCAPPPPRWGCSPSKHKGFWLTVQLRIAGKLTNFQGLGHFQEHCRALGVIQGGIT